MDNKKAQADEAMARYELERAAKHDDASEKHAPTPWEVDDSKSFYVLANVPPYVVCNASTKPTAAFIVRAFATLAQIVRTQNGNRHEDINALLDCADKAIAAASA